MPEWQISIATSRSSIRLTSFNLSVQIDLFPFSSSPTLSSLAHSARVSRLVNGNFLQDRMYMCTRARARVCVFARLKQRLWISQHTAWFLIIRRETKENSRGFCDVSIKFPAYTSMHWGRATTATIATFYLVTHTKRRSILFFRTIIPPGSRVHVSYLYLYK